MVQFNEKYFATLFAKISQLLQQLEKQAQVQTDEFHLLPLHYSATLQQLLRRRSDCNCCEIGV